MKRVRQSNDVRTKRERKFHCARNMIRVSPERFFILAGQKAHPKVEPEQASVDFHHHARYKKRTGIFSTTGYVHDFIDETLGVPSRTIARRKQRKLRGKAKRNASVPSVLVSHTR